MDEAEKHSKDLLYRNSLPETPNEDKYLHQRSIEIIDGLTLEIMAHQVADGYQQGYQHGRSSADLIAEELQGLRKKLKDIKEIVND